MKQLWNKLIKEVRAKRVAGPFNEIPFDNYIQSPIGMVLKSEPESKQTRLIFHLSYDFGEKTSDKSLNLHTREEICLVKYNNLNKAVAQ